MKIFNFHGFYFLFFVLHQTFFLRFYVSIFFVISSFFHICYTVFETAFIHVYANTRYTRVSAHVFISFFVFQNKRRARLELILFEKNQKFDRRRQSGKKDMKSQLLAHTYWFLLPCFCLVGHFLYFRFIFRFLFSFFSFFFFFFSFCWIRI